MTETVEAVYTAADVSELDAPIPAVPSVHDGSFAGPLAETAGAALNFVDPAELDAPVEPVDVSDVADGMPPIAILVPAEPLPFGAPVQDTGSPHTVTSETAAPRARTRRATPNRPTMQPRGKAARRVDPELVAGSRRPSRSRKGRKAIRVHALTTAKSVEALRKILLDLALDLVGASDRPKDLIKVVARLDSYVDRIIEA
jgi:hypothetical protein